MISNIEPLAREMTEHICRRNGMSEANIQGWVDLHWQCAAAMLEAGVMDENGEWITGKDVHLGIEAYRERFARQDETRLAASITKSRSSSFDHG
jgi:hypothetical protein